MLEAKTKEAKSNSRQWCGAMRPEFLSYYFQATCSLVGTTNDGTDCVGMQFAFRPLFLELECCDDKLFMSYKLRHLDVVQTRSDVHFQPGRMQEEGRETGN